jgi:hypothetical protein
MAIFVFDRQLDQTNLDLKGHLGVAETAIVQSQDTQDDQQDRGNLVTAFIRVPGAVLVIPC